MNGRDLERAAPGSPSGPPWPMPSGAPVGRLASGGRGRPRCRRSRGGRRERDGPEPEPSGPDSFRGGAAFGWRAVTVTHTSPPRGRISTRVTGESKNRVSRGRRLLRCATRQPAQHEYRARLRRQRVQTNFGRGLQDNVGAPTRPRQKARPQQTRLAPARPPEARAPGNGRRPRARGGPHRHGPVARHQVFVGFIGDGLALGVLGCRDHQALRVHARPGPSRGRARARASSDGVPAERASAAAARASGLDGRRRARWCAARGRAGCRVAIVESPPGVEAAAAAARISGPDKPRSTIASSDAPAAARASPAAAFPSPSANNTVATTPVRALARRTTLNGARVTPERFGRFRRQV